MAERLCPAIGVTVPHIDVSRSPDARSPPTLCVNHPMGKQISFCSAFVDLNRDFPDPMLLGYNNLSATGSEQPETLAMMKWIKSRHFVASASMHEVGI